MCNKRRTDRRMDNRVQDYQDSVLFARSFELSIRVAGFASNACTPPSMLPVDWCSPSFHRHDYINQKARTLFLSPFPSPFFSFLFFSWAKAPRGKVTWIRVIESADDRRERIKYRTGRALDCRLRWEGWKRTEHVLYHPSRDRRDAPFFLSIPLSSPIMHPSPLVLRVLFGEGARRACLWQSRRGSL